MPDQSKITLDLNVLDDSGVVVDRMTCELTREQISDIVDHAAQLILVRRDSQDLQGTLDELEEALVVSGVIDEAPDAAPAA